MSFSISHRAATAATLLGTLAGHLIPNDSQASSSAAPSVETDGSSTLNGVTWHTCTKMKNTLPQSPLNLYRIMDDVEKAFPEGTDLVKNVDCIYQKLSEKLAPEFDTVFSGDESRTISEVHLVTLLERLQPHYENQALVTIWKQRLEKIFANWFILGQNVPPLEPTHDGIRTWLKDPANAVRLHAVTGLDLSSLNLKALPPEIGLFRSLHGLSLHGNALTYLPDEIGRLEALERLTLTNNQLTSLPEQIGSLSRLQTLWIANNELSSLPEQIATLTNLRELHLQKNQLTSIPEQTGSLSNLRVLQLQCNQLTSIPTEIGSLIALQTLSVENNKLTSIPQQISSCTSLQVLNLSNNQLTSIPEQISGLNALEELWLSSNKLISLPEKISSMDTLKMLDLDRNPLMFIADNLISKISSAKTLNRFREIFLKYPTQTSLGDFFRLIATNADPVSIQNAFDELDPNMQRRIAELAGVPVIVGASSSSSSASSSSMLIDTRLFDDIPGLGRAAREATLEKFAELSEDVKDRVYEEIYQLAGRPETQDPKWGRRHLFNNMLRFVDALEKATSSAAIPASAGASFAI